MTVFGREDEVRLLRPPRLRTLGGEDGRRASSLELFFDPATIVAIVALKLWTAQCSLRASEK